MYSPALLSSCSPWDGLQLQVQDYSSTHPTKTYNVPSKGQAHARHQDTLKNKTQFGGQPGWPSSLALPSAQGMILVSRDRVPHWATCMEPASPSACVSASLSLSLSNK